MGNALTLLWFAAIARVAWGYLRRGATELDHAHAQLLASQMARAADAARFGERRRQYGLLHDTVLSTLTALSRGGLDLRSEQVRERCAADAGFLRRLITADAPEPQENELSAGLSRAAQRAEALGLQVNLMTSHETVSALSAAAAFELAVTEALNNVHHHAGTSQAWVTSHDDGPQVCVRVVDRGRGFDPLQVPIGIGIPQSIVARMSEAGGCAMVDSRPGQGTCWELRWPA
jgi:signal transduction histidine kinase